MSVSINNELLERLHNSCVAELSQVMSASFPEDSPVLKLDAVAALSLIAWQIVVPFVVAASATVAAQKLTADKVKKQSASELKQLVTQMLGARINVEDDTSFEECVLLVQELLEPFQVTRPQARQIIEHLRAKTIEPPE
jgi:hypothetical protein